MLGKLTLSEPFPTKCYMQANNLSPDDSLKSVTTRFQLLQWKCSVLYMKTNTRCESKRNPEHYAQVRKMKQVLIAEVIRSNASSLD